LIEERLKVYDFLLRKILAHQLNRSNAMAKKVIAKMMVRISQILWCVLSYFRKDSPESAATIASEKK
jgi:hypothetical protein